MRRYLGWLVDNGVDDLAAVDRGMVENYLKFLRGSMAASSASRALIVARGLHKFAVAEGILDVDVASEVTPPRNAQHLPETLQIEEVEKLLDSVPTGEVATPIDIRDRALLELLYGTGARITEVTSLTVDDVTENDGMLMLTGKGDKQRLVPVGSQAQKAVEEYLVRGRPVLSKGKSHALFLNTRGGSLSRQSAWAVLKQAPRGPGLKVHLTAHAAPLLCHAPIRRRCGRAYRAGAAGAFLGDNHADLYPRHCGFSARSLAHGASQGLGLNEFKNRQESK